MCFRGLKPLMVASLVFSIGFLYGCAGMEYVNKKGIAYYHTELPAADRALAAAKAAGKDKECPEAYKYAEKMKDDAYKTYWECRTTEALKQANEAAAMAKGLCPKLPLPEAAKVAPPPPPPDKGKCADLTWSSTSASTVSIDPAIGKVSAGGSRQVCPDTTTQYTITAAGEGGTKTASTTVTVNPPVDFVKKYPGHKISVEGHTDSTGNAKSNQALSERRAAAVKKYLLDNGASDGDKIKSVGFGASKPIADNKTKKGKFENRRVEILILSR